jgi:LacI family transcriptional regulator, repressor for deo operon, udp, cdd, tsx, nupC, and nupG
LKIRATGKTLRSRAWRTADLSPKKHRKTFGILTTPAKNIFNSNYHRGLLSGILPRIKAVKGRLKVVMMPARPYRSLDQILDEHGLDGFMILTWRWIHPEIARLIEISRHVRVLVVNDPVPGLGVNNIYTDTDAGMAQAVAHLVKNGCRKIGMLHGPWEVSFKVGKKKIAVPFVDTRLKVKGLIRALKAERLLCDRGWFRSGGSNSEAEGCRVMKKWLLEKNLPEAIVCGNDDLAFGALKALKEAGKRAPQDMAIVGFDDNERAKSFSPPLTTVRQPLFQMGKDAVDILIRQIERPASGPISKQYLPKLIVRKTA